MQLALKATFHRLPAYVIGGFSPAGETGCLEPVYDLCIKVILTQRKSDETFLPK